MSEKYKDHFTMEGCGFPLSLFTGNPADIDIVLWAETKTETNEVMLWTNGNYGHWFQPDDIPPILYLWNEQPIP